MLKKIVYLVLILFLFLGFGTTVRAEQGDHTFSLKDVTGRAHTFTEYGDTRALVVIFVSTRCPVSNAYNGRMEALYKMFRDENIAFLGINANRAETVDEIAGHARENSLTFPILKDPDNRVADQYGASVTPEIFVFSGKRKLLYHGRIDNSANEEKANSKDLQMVLSAIAAGDSPEFKETKAFGCSIKRKEK